MSAVTEFIREKGFEALETELGIKVKHYPEVGLYLLNYDQIESPKTHPVVIECRSLVVDEAGIVVSRAFDRFFNWGEAPEVVGTFNLSESVVMEKADGSLVTLFYVPKLGQWVFRTRGMLFAEGENELGTPFSKMILDAAGFESLEDLNTMVGDLDKSCSIIFELIGPMNRIVTRYEKAELVLLGARYAAGDEVNATNLASLLAYLQKVVRLNVRAANLFNLSGDMDGVTKSAAGLHALDEGYVVWHPATGRRTKIKNPAYVAIHHIRGETALTRKRALTLIVMNEQDEFLTYFPEYKDFFDPITAEVQAFLADLDAVWPTVKDIEGQKEFALQVKDRVGFGVYFEARKRGITPSEVFADMDINKKMKLFGF